MENTRTPGDTQLQRVRTEQVKRVAELRPHIESMAKGVRFSGIDLLSHVIARGIAAVEADIQGSRDSS